MIRETPSAPSTEDLIALIAALTAENESLMARIAELERQLGLNSSNSGKSPSSDGLKKPARVTSLRERSAKKPGGQKGHKGETLREVADPPCAASSNSLLPPSGTRTLAYYRAVTDFFAWLNAAGIGTLVDIEPLHVATYIRGAPGENGEADRQAAPRRHPHAVRLACHRRHPRQSGPLGFYVVSLRSVESGYDISITLSGRWSISSRFTSPPILEALQERRAPLGRDVFSDGAAFGLSALRHRKIFAAAKPLRPDPVNMSMAGQDNRRHVRGLAVMGPVVRPREPRLS
jgi:Family of unknown function (DUF6444)